MTINAGVAGGGVAIADNPDDPSLRGGKSFSDAFGLNDLITGGPTDFATGLTGTDEHGFATGQSITFAVRDEYGDVSRTIDIPMTTGETFDDIVTQLNAPGALGPYATAAFDETTGRLQLTPRPGQDVSRIDVAEDTTARGGAGGTSLSELFGLGDQAQTGRSNRLGLNPDMVSDPQRLATAQADLEGATAGDLALAPGDTRGAIALSEARNDQRTFSAVGGLSEVTTDLTDYLGRVGGEAGRRASSADNRAASAQAISDEATLRRTSVEGVNLDEELVNMTTYQQAYSASARLLTVAQEMYDTLLSIV